ncbi:MAG: hypothetical protein EOM62_08745 [Bacteroidia bacterium]|nr:hypothetical protein [Bacteroidia bacterium]
MVGIIVIETVYGQKHKPSAIRISPSILLWFLLFFITTLCSCKNISPSEIQPEWISSISTKIADGYSITGGPATTIEEAKALAYAEMSALLKVYVQDSTAVKTNITTMMDNPILLESLYTASSIKTIASLQDVYFPDVYHDKTNNLYYVRAVFTNEALENSIRETEEEFLSRQERYRDFVPTLQRYIENLNNPATQIQDKLAIVARALQFLEPLDFEQSLLITTETTGTIPVYSYLVDVLREIISSITFKAQIRDTGQHVLATLPWEISVLFTQETNLNLPWILDQTKPSGNSLSFTTFNTQPKIVDFPLKRTDTSDYHFLIKLDMIALGFSEQTIVNLGNIPISVVILSIPPPSITLEVQLHETIVSDYSMVNDFLIAMLSEGLVTPLTTIPSDIVLRFDLQPSFERHPDFGITFCSLRPSLNLVNRGTLMFSHAYASIKEGGSSDTQALERALKTLEKNFHDNLQIRNMLDSAMQALLP